MANINFMLNCTLCDKLTETHKLPTITQYLGNDTLHTAGFGAIKDIRLYVLYIKRTDMIQYFTDFFILILNAVVPFLFLCVHTYFSLHRILNNNKIQELRNGSFFGLSALEKL